VAALLLVGLAVALLTRGGGNRDGGRGDGTGAGQTVQIQVDGTLPWTDTKVNVEAGDQVMLVPDGEVTYDVDARPSIGPVGIPNRPELLTPYPDMDHAADRPFGDGGKAF
jgi:hypothetical protein